MIEAPRLLKDLQRLLRTLEDDLRERASEVSEVDGKLRAQYAEAKRAERTAQAYEMWRDELLTQVAVAWILGCVFVRFLEDNELVETPRLSGPGERRQQALDQHELFFKAPDLRTASDREYLLDVFTEFGKLPAAREIFDVKHNPLWIVGLSGDAAATLLRFWQRVDPESGELAHNFTDPEWNTRFLGDLYQDLSESARKKYALLQTPEFVEEFILDRTLTPAIEEFGLAEVRLIDPTCGSGHFLLGAFQRLFELWVAREAETNSRTLAQRIFNQVYGVDLNPFAVAIARFRLLLAALQACGIKRLGDAPGFQLSLAVGDSLLHGKRFSDPALGKQQTLIPEQDPVRHVYETEDAAMLERILGQQYSAVVGNPPYITVKDKALNQEYRKRYSACRGKYSLVAPFVERFFELAASGNNFKFSGLTGIIVANSFMKREFGKHIVENHLPRIDLTHVIDTSGAYIPGHGTPTVILLGRNRPPATDAIRAVMGIRGEPKTPEVAADGIVWRSIISHIDRPGEENAYISAADVSRETFSQHPWSIGGGGAAELKKSLENRCHQRLGMNIDTIGFASFSGLDDAFVMVPGALSRLGAPPDMIKKFVYGEIVRDWRLSLDTEALSPYDERFRLIEIDKSKRWFQHLWRLRGSLEGVVSFGGKTRKELNDQWWGWYRWLPEKYRTALSITFAFVATHNHFVLDRGGKVFNRTAPIIKLPQTATEDDHLALLALLNSSVACFWMKQVFHDKGAGGIGGGLATEEWERRYEFTGTGLRSFPIARDKPIQLAIQLDSMAQQIQEILPHSWGDRTPELVREAFRLQDQAQEKFEQMISLQEELDWRCYAAYGITDKPLVAEGNTPGIAVGHRSFEFELAKRIKAGELQTTWFERHGSTPRIDPPEHFPPSYRNLIERRMQAIRSNQKLALLEQPEFKRRWSTVSWSQQLDHALRDWLESRLESPQYWSRAELVSAARLADLARQDEDFMTVAEAYRGHADFDETVLVAELIANEAAPVLSALRYKTSGLTKYDIWKQTWNAQRHEDAIDARTELPEDHPHHLSLAEAKDLKAKEVGDITVPPKYRTADYQNTIIWRHRGRLDVPKERFISLPHCEREADPSLVIGWAGWTHLEQSQAIATYYIEMKEQEGWTPERLTPLLTGLQELLPWVKQWHNDPDPEHGVRMGDYYEDFLNEEARSLGLTLEQIESWKPPKKARARKPRKKSAPKSPEQT